LENRSETIARLDGSIADRIARRTTEQENLAAQQGYCSVGVSGDGAGGDAASNDNAPEPLTLSLLHADHLGRPAFATDITGAVIWDGGITTPFGEQISTAGALAQNLMFPGQYADTETGLSDNWHRTYDPALGRYLQSDPIGLAGGLNRYAYVGGNPVSFVDPTGEVGLLGAILGGGFNFGLQYIQNGGRLECIDWADVATSAVLGAFIPGSFSSFKTAKGAIKTSRQYGKYLKKAKDPKNIKRFQRKKLDADNDILNQITLQSGAQVSKFGLKNAFDFETADCGC